MSLTLFIYGTLHPDRAPREIAWAARRLISLGAATIHARLYSFGEYPGVILDASAAPIPGELFAVPDDDTLAGLDAYEDFRPGCPDASLFLRVESAATLPDGSVQGCWVYVYNGVAAEPAELFRGQGSSEQVAGVSTLHKQRPGF